MTRESPKEVWAWLRTRPSLTELCSRFPEEWKKVQLQIAAVAQRGKPGGLQTEHGRTSRDEEGRDTSFRNRRSNRKSQQVRISEHVQTRITYLAIKNYGMAAATGIKEGKVRFNVFNGMIVQSLLFSRDLERKPASLFWFRTLWPFVWQKNLLMPLAETKGIYCFYSKELIVALANMIGSRSCLEIAAGDGTLARFLKDHGVQITATDSGSWKHAVDYPDFVKRLDARKALKAYSPEVVICSWPPAKNDFERHVFKTRSVQLYIVIGSRLNFAAGNWRAYNAQSTFSIEEDRALSRLVLPPELGSAVHVFSRNPTSPLSVIRGE